MTEQVFGIMLKHGDDDYSVWTPDFSNQDTQAFLAFLEQYTDNGSSIRGSKQDIIEELTETL